MQIYDPTPSAFRALGNFGRGKEHPTRLPLPAGHAGRFETSHGLRRTTRVGAVARHNVVPPSTRQGLCASGVPVFLFAHEDTVRQHREKTPRRRRCCRGRISATPAGAFSGVTGQGWDTCRLSHCFLSDSGTFQKYYFCKEKNTSPPAETPESQGAGCGLTAIRGGPGPCTWVVSRGTSCLCAKVATGAALDAQAASRVSGGLDIRGQTPLGWCISSSSGIRRGDDSEP
jgi:hypothetical protein